MNLDFSNRRVAVTGAAQGIGRGIVQSLAAEGARVWALDLDEAGLRMAAEAGAVATRALDLSDRAAVSRVFAEMAETLDGIDILVNCAGGVRGQVARPIEEVSEQDWLVLFEANVHGAFWCSQAAAPHMKRQKFGRIVNISSGAGLRPSLTGIQAYTASKHALVGLTKQLSFELGPFGITVNSVAPGFVLSNPATQRQWESYGPEGQARLLESIHTHRLGYPQDIANAVMFLASDAAAWISGQIISVDGGRS
ncbi:3-oxoacyl-[acyl-carrier protein] reductase [Microvirga flocculans]|uniref:3-oxoacyl-[acyl-carrier protein] reductase n=1 Tax=Microvirga flocculans TaxID=217168 RepID=A0A7W6IHV4_9HYPH|nr:SDR family NAD(P)-dependent oxidoreductase [Microvirga flocculans]MBB4041752.1 3-oxoacyl-[acyl-carrier protein] reductase [Microvirga flocculans]